MVLSDHGFATWRRSVNYNTWLVENGFMTLTGERRQAGRPRDALRAGRVLAERGLVEDEGLRDGARRHLHQPEGARRARAASRPGAEYEAVREEIRKKLVTLVDPKTGQRAVSRIFTREEAYGSFDADVIPDLFVTNTAGTRIGWQGSLGVVTKEMFEDNAQIWSGDHCSLDPAVVPGILFANRPLPKGRLPGIADVPATIYNVLGVDAAREARRGAALLRRLAALVALLVLVRRGRARRSRRLPSPRRDAGARGDARRRRSPPPPSASPSARRSSQELRRRIASLRAALRRVLAARRRTSRRSSSRPSSTFRSRRPNAACSS